MTLRFMEAAFGTETKIDVEKIGRMPNLFG